MRCDTLTRPIVNLPQTGWEIGEREREREKIEGMGRGWGVEGIVEVGFVIESEEPRLSKLGPAARRDRERRTK